MREDELTRRYILKGAAALTGAAALGNFISIEPAVAGGLTKMTMQLGWLADNGNLGEAVAIQKGFFKEEGINLTIRPGGPNVNGVAGVASGQAALGQTSSSPAIMLARSAGIPVKAFAAGFQKHPFTYFSLNKDPIRSPKDMIGKTIATQPTARILLRALLAKNGIPDNKVKVVNAGSNMNELMSGRVQAETGWLTDGSALKVLGPDRVDLMLWDTGIRLYANVYFTSDHTLAKHADELARFTRANARGWIYAKNHPTEAVDLLVKSFPNLNKAINLSSVGEVLKFSFNKATEADGWGTMNAKNWAAQIKTYASLKQFKGPVPKVDDVMTMSILDATKKARKVVS